MTQAQFEVRKARSDNGAMIASKTEEGFRVYSLSNSSQVYLVKQNGDQWVCTCPDCEIHKADTTWRCKHVLTVAPWQKTEHTEAHQPENGQVAEPTVPTESHNEPPAPRRRTRKDSNGSAQMLIKRSVSPDGRIDSVSVEFSMPVSDISNGEIKDKALRTLKHQKEIVGSFLKLNGQKATDGVQTSQTMPSENPDGKPVFARMIDIGKINGKYGERLCINLQINGRWPRIFGSANELALQIAKAGHHIDPQNIEDGLRLNLACLVVTKPSSDGKCFNVERVLSLPKGGKDAGALN